jgi:hypothetical protein
MPRQTKQDVDKNYHGGNSHDYAYHLIKWLRDFAVVDQPPDQPKAKADDDQVN